MNNDATVVIGGIGAFSAFCPPVTDAASVDLRRLRISEGYAAGATILLGILASKTAGSPSPLVFAFAIVGIELLAYEHARMAGSNVVNQ